MLKRRIEALEQQGESEAALMIVIGEPTPEQQELIDNGNVRCVIQMPDNQRGDYGRDPNKA